MNKTLSYGHSPVLSLRFCRSDLLGRAVTWLDAVIGSAFAGLLTVSFVTFRETDIGNFSVTCRFDSLAVLSNSILA